MVVRKILILIFDHRCSDLSIFLQFNDFAYEIADVSHVNAANVYGLMDSFSSTITSFALSSDSEWPYVTVPHFEVRGQKFFNVVHVKSGCILVA